MKSNIEKPNVGLARISKSASRTCLCFIFTLAIAMTARATDLLVDVHSFVSSHVVGRRVQLTLLDPGPVTAGPWFLAGDAVSLYTGTNGQVLFTNVLNGGYRLDIFGTPGRSYPLGVPDTNAQINAVALVGATNTLPYFYTALQIDDLLDNLVIGGGGITVAQGTNAVTVTNGQVITVSGEVSRATVTNVVTNALAIQGTVQTNDTVARLQAQGTVQTNDTIARLQTQGVVQTNDTTARLATQGTAITNNDVAKLQAQGTVQTNDTIARLQTQGTVQTNDTTTRLAAQGTATTNYAAGTYVPITSGTANNFTANNTTGGHIRFGVNAGGSYIGLIGDPQLQVLKGDGTTGQNLAFLGSDEVQPRGLLIGSVITGPGPVIFFDGYDFTGGGITDFPISFQHASLAPVLIGTSSALTAGPMLQVHGDVLIDGAYNGNGSGMTNFTYPPISFTIDGYGSTIGSGSNAVKIIANNLLIKGVSLAADASGSIQLDIRRCTTNNYDGGSTHPVSGDSIVASAPPKLVSHIVSYDNVLSGWTKTLSAGDMIQVFVTSASGVHTVTGNIEVVPR